MKEILDICTLKDKLPLLLGLAAGHNNACVLSPLGVGGALTPSVKFLLGGIKKKTGEISSYHLNRVKTNLVYKNEYAIAT